VDLNHDANGSWRILRLVFILIVPNLNSQSSNAEDLRVAPLDVIALGLDGGGIVLPDLDRR
jgi:hypothetical protein